MNAHSNSPDSGNFNFEPIQHKRNVQTFHEKSGRCVSVRAAREQMSADPGVRRLFIATPKWADYHRPPPVHPRSSGDVIRVGGDLKPRPLRLDFWREIPFFEIFLPNSLNGRRKSHVTRRNCVVSRKLCSESGGRKKEKINGNDQKMKMGRLSTGRPDSQLFCFGRL